MKKVLIAGGNGVIGRLLVEGLRADYEVTVPDKDYVDGTAVCKKGFPELFHVPEYNEDTI